MVDRQVKEFTTSHMEKQIAINTDKSNGYEYSNSLFRLKTEESKGAHCCKAVKQVNNTSENILMIK